MDWSHIFSGEVRNLYFFSVSSAALLILLLKFCFFLNGHKVFDVINVCCLILLFVLTRFLYIGISHQSNVSFFFYSTESFVLEAIFSFTHQFL